MDTIILDLETKDMYGPSTGKTIPELSASFVGIFSYAKNQYMSFFEQDFPELKKLLSEPALIVGFPSNMFDIPVLTTALGMTFEKHPKVDLCEELEARTGRRVGLNTLGLVNLGYGKTGHGLGAPQLYAEGRTQELRDYCLNDVKLTKELYDLIRTQKKLKIPQEDSVYSNHLGIFEKNKLETVLMDLGPLLTFL